MAHTSEYQRWLNLQSLIQKALEEAISFDDGITENTPMTLAISPDRDEVYATPYEWWDDEILSSKIDEGWNIENASNFEEAIAIADLYFDCRDFG